ncbi:DUF6082 family protein [Streptomyces sp. L7]
MRRPGRRFPGCAEPAGQGGPGPGHPQLLPRTGPPGTRDDMALFQPVWGDTDIVDPHDERKRHVYADLMMNYAWVGFEIGTIRESVLRDMLAGMFTGEAGRRYRTRAHTSWIASCSGSRVGRRFARRSWARSTHGRLLPDRRPARRSPPVHLPYPSWGRRPRGGHRSALWPAWARAWRSGSLLRSRR